MDQSPVVAQGDNKLTGFIVNQGSTPLQARAYIKAEADGIVLAESSRSLYTIMAGQGATVPMSWDGPALEAGVDQIKFTLEAWVEAGGQEVDDSRKQMSIVRAVNYNDFSLSVISSTATIERGETQTIGQVEITNTGNVADTAQVTIPAVQGWSLAITPSQVALDPGQSKTLHIDATAPGDQDSVGTSTQFTLQAKTSQLRADNEDQELSPFRAFLNLATPTVEDGDNLRITVTSSPEIPATDPGGTIAYTVVVYNPTGTQRQASLAFGSEDAPDDVAFDTQSGTATLGPGQSASFVRQAVVDPAAFAGSHAWWVKTTEGAFENQQTLGLTVNQMHEVAFTISQGTRDVAPGDDASEMLSLSNLGNGEVEICVEAELPNSWTPDIDCVDVGVAIAIDGGSTWNETQGFLWNVATPTWAAAGDYEIPLYVTDGVAQSDARTITFNILEQTHPVLVLPDGDPRPIFGLEDPELDPEDGPTLPVIEPVCVFGVEPGKQRIIEVGLGNEGNVDGDFHLSFQTHQEGSWIVTLPQASHSLPQGDHKSVSIKVEAPELATPEDFVVLEMRLEEVMDGQAVPERSETKSCLVGAAYPDITLQEGTPKHTPVHLYADHPSVVHFRVLNTGWADTGAPIQVRSVIEGPDFKHEQDHQVPALEKYGGFWWDNLAIQFNATKAGQYTYTLEADPDHLIEEPEGNAAPNTLTGTFTVHDFGIKVDAPVGRVAIPEQTVSFEELTESEFVIHNDGDRTHTLTLNLSMQPAWKTFKEHTITLGPDDKHIINATFTVPEFPQTHEATLTLRASNATLPSLAVEDVVRVRIDDDEGPLITAVSSNVSHVLVGGVVEFSAHIVDAAGVAAAKLFVVAPDGTVSIHDMEGGPVFTATATFSILGNHSVHIWARDAAVSNNTADTTDDPIQIEVLSDNQPHIRLVTPDEGSYLRPGVPVVLTVLSKHPIVEATYDLGSGPVPVSFANPLQLPTDDWLEGPTNVEIRVRDAMGVPANNTYSFIIDGTPPVVADLRLDPANALPGTKVRVLAVLEDESGIQEAEVRVGRLDGRVEVSQLAHETGNTWATQIQLPTDVVSVTVVATDLAGNRGFGEKLLHGLEGDDKGMPSTAVPLLIAALAALARRRGSK